MAFEMDGEFVLPAPREAVWAALNDPEVLRRSIQGCQKLDVVGENAFVAEVAMKIGPVSAKFSGRVQLCDLDPPNGYRIEGSGDGGTAGFAKGGARVSLSAVEGGTRLHYVVNADIGGRLAQLGGRLINGVAKKQADQFFEAFAKQFGSGDDPVQASAQGRPAAGLEVSAGGGMCAPLVHAPVPFHGASPAMPLGWFLALGLAVLAGFMLGRSAAADGWVVAVVLLSLGSAAAGYSLGMARIGR